MQFYLIEREKNEWHFFQITPKILSSANRQAPIGPILPAAIGGSKPRVRQAC